MTARHCLRQFSFVPGFHHSFVLLSDTVSTGRPSESDNPELLFHVLLASEYVPIRCFLAQIQAQVVLAGYGFVTNKVVIDLIVPLVDATVERDLFHDAFDTVDHVLFLSGNSCHVLISGLVLTVLVDVLSWRIGIERGIVDVSIDFSTSFWQGSV